MTKYGTTMRKLHPLTEGQPPLNFTTNSIFGIITECECDQSSLFLTIYEFRYWDFQESGHCVKNLNRNEKRSRN